MAFFSNKPNIPRLVRRGDVDGLAAALEWQDAVRRRDGTVVDAGGTARREAVAGLATLGSEDAVRAVTYALDDPDETVAVDAIEVLRWRGGRVGLEEIGAAAARWAPDSHHEAHAVALATLIDTNPGLGLRSHVGALARERHTALDARDRAAVKRLVAEAEDTGRAIDQVLDLAQGAEPGVADDLLSIFGAAARDRLMAALVDPAKRAMAAAALGRLHDRRALEALTEHLHDPNPKTRRAVVIALGQLKEPAALGSLFQATQDEDYEVRVAALTALDGFGAVAVAATMLAATEPLGRRLSSLIGDREPRHQPPRLLEARTGLVPRVRGWLRGSAPEDLGGIESSG